MSEIIIDHVSKTFNSDNGEVHALHDICLSIDKGDIYGIIGMSGAGKSTLVRCLNYLEVPTSGEVIIQGTKLSELDNKSLNQMRRKVSMIFQNFNLLMQKSVIDNVCFPLKIMGVEKDNAKAKAEHLLDVVGLTDKKNAYPAQLSGGQRQRVAIARALACDPEILLCDEATSALDPATSMQILDLLKDINERLGITIIVITHQMSVIKTICHHVAILENGVIQEKGDVETIFTHPTSEVGKKLIMGGQ